MSVRHLDFSLGRTQTGKDWTRSMTTSHSTSSIVVRAHPNNEPAFKKKTSLLGTVFETLSVSGA